MIVLSVGLCILALQATETTNFSSLLIRHNVSNRQKSFSSTTPQIFINSTNSSIDIRKKMYLQLLLASKNFTYFY